MIIIITAHIPIFTLQRHEGRIFAPMAWTVTSALVGSLVFSLTLVPLLAYWLLPQTGHHEENWPVRASKRLFLPALRWAIGRRALVIGLALAAFLASLAMLPRLGSEFLPELNEGTIWVNATLPPGISVDAASAYCRRMREILHQTPEVRSAISKAGRPEDGTDPKPVNMVEIFVDLLPPAERRPGKTEADRLDALPGVETSFSQPIRDNVLESISQIDGQVVVKVFGDDPDRLRESSEAILRAVRGVSGVSRAFVDRAGQVPQSIIEVDRERAA